MVSALDLGDLGPTRERSRCTQGHQHTLGTRVREPNLLDPRNAIAQKFSEFNLDFGWHTHCKEFLRLLSQCSKHRWVAVPVNQRRPVVHEVNAFGAIDINHATALATRGIERIRLKHHADATVAARHYQAATLVQFR
ncbi:unannotated protein [freshwater metagenome]|uniref:Unannotated protein n=1 Tax=freshwater metagenome TaxID=449393 RepID=A0A6J6PKH0_9ZZZZ